MNVTRFSLSAICSILLFSCQSNTKKALDTDDTISRHCYLAIQNKDTADLDLITLRSGNVRGKMLMKFSDNPHGQNKGTLDGKFNGDTLYADYTFTVGKYKTVWKNPLAFLRRQDTLTLGVGTIDSYMGRSEFRKSVPINYEKGRFKFKAVDCP